MELIIIIVIYLFVGVLDADLMFDIIGIYDKRLNVNHRVRYGILFLSAVLFWPLVFVTISIWLVYTAVRAFIKKWK